MYQQSMDKRNRVLIIAPMRTDDLESIPAAATVRNMVINRQRAENENSAGFIVEM
jgi:hypothetical protein